MTVIAMSAAYGARGATIGPAVAEHLGVPFVNRALDLRVAGTLDVSVDEARSQWDEPPARSFLERLLSSFLGIDSGAPVGLPPETVSADDFRRAAEAAVLEQASTGEGVILGRGAVAALRDRPQVLRVRLSGPKEGRLAHAREAGGLDEETAIAAMKRIDRYHADYMREFYEVDIDDPALYHVTLDATVLGTETCVELIEIAARSL